MKILHITPIAPGNLSGGEIGVRQTIFSLVNNRKNEVDYIGPQIMDESICNLYCKTYILYPDCNPLLRFYDMIRKKTNKRYRAWRRAGLDYEKYDIVVMDFTRQHYVLEQVPPEKLIVRVHNVEQDYAYNNWRHERSVKNLIEYFFAHSKEEVLVKKARRLIVLTKEDKDRLCRLYNINDEKIFIIPVCMKEHVTLQLLDKPCHPTFTMILNGSLWFGPNYEGIKWFLLSVYPRLKFSKRLIIAGSRPNQELIKIISGDDTIMLVDTPPVMGPYLEMADMAIAPIFDGAGMKVKVAEALAYALPVVGTPHAFVGYNIQNEINSYCANTADEFVECIKKYQSFAAEKRKEVSNAAYQLYQNCYSQSASTIMFQNVMTFCE